MAKKPAKKSTTTQKATRRTKKPQISSKGTCVFCNETLDKSEMIAHLQSCKERSAALEAENQSSKKKTKIFHLLVEGQYHPTYWMHLEIPARESLFTLDGFLRDTWLECCGHLSEFKIGNMSYTGGPPEMYMDFSEVLTPPEEQPVIITEVQENEEGDDEDEEDEEMEDLSMEDMANGLTAYLTAELGDLSKASLADIENKLLEIMQSNSLLVPQGQLVPEMQSQLHIIASLLQSGELNEMVADGMLDDEKDELDEMDMDVKLKKVLKVGQDFSHIYDFGSSTYLHLQVLGERDGVAPPSEEESPVRLLAQNEPPEFACRQCGKPATQIEANYYPDYRYLPDGALCDACAEQGGMEEETLPLVNSPRTGVCGYEGPYDEEWDEEEWDEDEEDEES